MSERSASAPIFLRLPRWRNDFRSGCEVGVPILLPLHWAAEGLPLGVQFVAPLAGEPLLIQLAAQLEQAMPWVNRVAPI